MSYTEIGLKDIQQRYYKYLTKLNTFLKENNIQYFAIGGTLLGAIRHGEMIPWDDDIDLGMTLENYDKFLSVCEKFENSDFKIENYSNTKYITYSFTRIIFKNLFYINSTLKDCYSKNYHIDIFPFYFVNPNQKKTRAQFKHILFIRKIFYYKSKDKFSKKIKNFFLKILQLFLSPFSCRFLAKKIDFLSRKYKPSAIYSDTKLINICGVYSFDKETIEYSWISQIIEKKFGPCNISVPQDFHAYLSHVYGKDYLTPKNLRQIDLKSYKGLQFNDD